MQAQLREHYRIHYDSNNVLIRNADTPLDQKPLGFSEIIEQEFVHNFDDTKFLIKNEKSESEFGDEKIYEDLSKKQKLNQ